MRYYNYPKKEFSLFIEEITDICFNVEYGKIVYKHNTLAVNANNYRDAENFPVFNSGSFQTYIRAPFGTIYIPNNLISKFVKRFERMIIKKSQIFKTVLGFDHLSSYTTLQTSNGDFISLKAQCQIFKNNSLYRKIKTSNGMENVVDCDIHDNRFTWFVNSLESFIENFPNNNDGNRFILYRLFSILYDPYNMFCLTNKEEILRSLTYLDFNIGSNIYKNINTNNTEPIDINNDFEKLEHKVVYCDVRKTAFEIIHLLGNSDTYINYINVDITEITEPIYEVNFNEIKIDIDYCNQCHTPLYGEIYVLFSNIYTNQGIPYCGVCLHAKFDVITNIYNPAGKVLYNDQIIAKTTYPKTINDLIFGSVIDNYLKEFLVQLSSDKHLVDEYENYKVIYLNFYDQTLHENKFIAFSGDLIDIVLYSCFNRHQLILDYLSEKKARKYILSCKIIPIQYVTY